MEITRHFTATTVIVSHGKVLLHLHKKLNIWLPVGGHIDRDELPEEAAMREIKEEAGLEVTFYHPDAKLEMGDVKQLLRPMHLLLENINPFHQHIDLVYYATSKTTKLKPFDGETKNLKWFTVNDIQKTAMPENVKLCALEALKLLS